MSEPSVSKSNPFSNLEGLLEALSKAPQDKQGAFRVSTWKMVIAEFLKLREQVTNQPQVDVNKLKEDLSKDFQNKIEADDADTILF